MEHEVFGSGYWSVATNTDHMAVAASDGVSSAATNTGFWSKAKSAGDWSAATNTGNWSTASCIGDKSVAISTGCYSAAESDGADAVAIVTGASSKVRGTLGSWIVAAEYDCTGHIAGIKAACVDGDAIKPGVWYELVGGTFREVQHEEHP